MSNQLEITKIKCSIKKLPYSAKACVGYETLPSPSSCKFLSCAANYQVIFLIWTTIWLAEQTNLSPSECASSGFYKNPLLPSPKIIWLHLYSEKESSVLTRDQRNKIRKGWRKLTRRMQILVFICTILTPALDCCPCFLLNSTMGPTRKFRLPCVLGHLRQMFIQIWNSFVASLCLCCWADVGCSEHHIACSNYRSYRKLECALLSMIYAYLNLSPHQSSPLLMWFKSPQLNTAGPCKTFLSQLSLLVYWNLFPFLAIYLALRLWWPHCYCNYWGEGVQGGQ